MSAWIVRVSEPESPVGRLVMVPHAGCGAAPYIRLSRHLDPRLAVGVVRLPGRESRLGERPETSMTAVVERLVEAIGVVGEEPLAVFGHCSGAWIAYELARAVSAAGRPPAALYVSGSPPPHRPAPLPSAGAGARELVRFLDAVGHTSSEILEDPDMARVLLTCLRGDLALLAGYRYRPGPALSCPIVAWYGLEDPDVPREHVEEWGRHTAAGTSVHGLPGAHFGPLAAPGALTAGMTAHLLSLVRAHA